MTAALLALGGGVVAAAPAQASHYPDRFTIEGSGYGHGVGMPQYGAYEMAREGATGVAILKHYYAGARAPYTTTPARISVQVFGPDPNGNPRYGDDASSTKVTVTGGAWRLRGPGGVTLAKGAGPETFTASTVDNKIRVAVDGKRYTGGPLRIHWSGTTYWRQDGAPAIADVAGAHGTYRHGRLTLTAKRGVPNIVNDLLLNTEYLYGVAEMPSSWGLSGGKRALRAQAMTARSYAMAHDTRRKICRCHVVDDVRDQNFTGWKKENEGNNGYYGKVWVRAVDKTTRGVREARVLRYQGAPVVAHYFSSSGGRTANSEEVWSAVIPYERSRKDPYSLRAPGNSYSSWTRTLTQQAARDLFGLYNVATIEVTRTWASGQVRTLRATQPNGKTATLTGKSDQMRAWLGRATTHGSLPAAWIRSIDPS
ncbi:SpoIID/LytB domain-containing protein [Isoptericola sp. 178]|uniref:SpoIID/LytB domain-containing protein n=1 Tax=Isoptericola sp. 178 TaxID=3064651 RepID=UPI0027137666|nr:SpoIID/LytB domain-containing protein [Isoptericola sp. 178]MDO8144120.1 SpoIID/LytB domain-containing protein [Isoptericola sp. 178]